MSEKLPDLNALRQNVLASAEAAANVEQRIRELQAKIQEAENTSGKSNFLDDFLALTPQEQEEEVSRVTRNRDLSEGSFSIEDRKKELQERDSMPPRSKDSAFAGLER